MKKTTFSMGMGAWKVPSWLNLEKKVKVQMGHGEVGRGQIRRIRGSEREKSEWLRSRRTCLGDSAPKVEAV